MTALLVTSVSSGNELDRVTLDDEGRLAYRTGAARDMFERRRALLGDDATDAEVAAALDGWSNGYVLVQAAAAAGGGAGQPQG